MAAPTNFIKAYNSFSGVDIKAVFSNKVIGELQAISYSITREKAPIYTMGSADPRSFSRGKRGIAGTLVFIVFDRHALLGTFGVLAPVNQQLKFLSDIDDIRPDPAQAANVNTTTAISTVGAAAGVATTGLGGLGAAYQAESDLSGGIDSDQVVTTPWFVDQIPPFDITLAAANEYGAFAVMRIYGVEILNEGYGVSIDDIVSEQQMTYVARTLVAWQNVDNPNGKTAAVQGGTA
jgi:hypothetical protein